MTVYDSAIKIVDRLTAAGHTAYFAGGWVRDHVMGHDSADIDIATSAAPEEIVSLFPSTILVGMAFGVVIVVVDGHQFEVATFRKDIEYTNGRTPDRVEYCSAREDALRRDFTINGMFYDPIKHEIYDYVDGVRDIKEGVIRTIGVAYDRFVEDRLRMIRAFRFSSRFGFVIDDETQKAIWENADTLFPSVAVERVWQEFCKMVKNPRFDTALVEMHRLGLLQVVFPLLQHEHLNDIKHRVAHFSSFPEETPPILYILQLFPGHSLEEMLDVCRYLKMSRLEAKDIETYFEGKRLVASEVYDPVEWVHFFADSKALLYLEVLFSAEPPEEKARLLKNYRERKTHFEKHVERIIVKKPLITGQKLKDEGIQAGLHMGVLMKEAERIAIENNLDDPEKVMSYLKKTPLWSSK